MDLTESQLHLLSRISTVSKWAEGMFEGKESPKVTLAQGFPTRAIMPLALPPHPRPPMLFGNIPRYFWRSQLGWVWHAP